MATKVKVECKLCGKATCKNKRYVDSRVKEGKTNFFCSRKCSSKHHSESMKGKSNPNYGGKFHGKAMKERTKEEREEIGRKISQTMILKGTSVGSNNGRWSGGFRTHSCVICGKESEYKPYEHREIIKGERNPCCSTQCVSANARRSLSGRRTSIEISMAEELDRRGLYFEEQYNLNDKFTLDFLIPEHDIVVECDGDYWHSIPEVVERDIRKNAYILSLGYTLYRFKEHEINDDIKSCVDEIETQINYSYSHEIII